MARLNPAHPWNPGYALPQNVIDEPYGQGVIITKQMKRGTISALQPEWLVDGAGGPAPGGARGSLGHSGNGSLGCAPENGSLGGNSLACGSYGSLSGSTLEGSGGSQVGGASDPIANFGRQSARLIMAEVRRLRPAERVDAMRVILGNIDGGLFDAVAKLSATYQEKGLSASAAMEKALAAALAGHYLDQLIKLGKSKRMPSSGVLAMGAACANGYTPVGGIWDVIKGAGGAVGSAAKKVGKGIGNLACKAANSSTLQGAAGAAGGPAATIGGALAADSLCGKGGAPKDSPYTPPASSFPLMPVLLIGGGLIAVLALRKK